MINFVLVIYIYAGALARGDSVTLAEINGFTTRAMCETAGKEAAPLVAGSAKELRYVCLRSK